jgi:chemotaxis protein MotA
MNSTFLGYVLFAIATYVLLVFGADEHLVKEFQQRYFSESTGRYVHLPGFFFVSTGVMASILISFSFREILQALRSLYIVFIRNKLNFKNYIETLRSVSEYTQIRDVETLEDFANGIKYPFLKDGLLMLVNGYKREEIKELLELRLENENHREEIDDDVWRAAARYSPGYGMLGTTVGLIQMFSQKIDAVVGFQGIINSMSIAFTTTLYGLFFANFVYQPIADKIERRNTEDFILKAMIIDGLLMIKDKKRASFVEEKLMNYIPMRRSMATIKMQILQGMKK